MIAPTSTDWQAAVRPGARIGGVVEAHDTIGSTNDRARDLLDGGAPDGIVVVAELQTAGRGRMGRTWTSPPGRNLTFSVGLRPVVRPDEAPILGLAAALALHAAVGRWGAVQLKWPNDLVSPAGAKVAGLLAEAASEGDRLRHVVIGFGINVNWAPDEMPPDLAAHASSVAALAGAPVDRVGLLRDLLGSLEREVAGVEAGRSPVPRYRVACSTLGARVRVQAPVGTLDGTAVDIDARGALVLRTATGESVTVTSGEVVRLRPGPTDDA